jgi:hypothetical protein
MADDREPNNCQGLSPSPTTHANLHYARQRARTLSFDTNLCLMSRAASAGFVCVVQAQVMLDAGVSGDA